MEDKIPEEITYQMIMEILPRKDRRRILNLMANSYNPIPKDKLEDDISWEKNHALTTGAEYSERDYTKNAIEIYKTFEKHLSPEFIYTVWVKAQKERWNRKTDYKLKPVKEGRDNKGVKVGGGYPQSNTVRWPKKNRSKATWKAFWLMFPKYDGFKSHIDWVNNWRELNKKEKEKNEAEDLENTRR